MADRPVPEKDSPHYDLTEIRRAVDGCRILITRSANEGAWDAGLDATDIPDCLQCLSSDDFHKSQQHEVPGLEVVWLDIYRPRFKNMDLYVKFHEDTFGKSDRFVVRSFKRDESPWTKRTEEGSP